MSCSRRPLATHATILLCGVYVACSSAHKPQDDTTIESIQPLTLGTLKTLGPSDANYWENATVAVPANTAGCGSAGAVVYALGGGIVQNGKTCNLLRFDLSCIQSTGSSCPVKACTTLPTIDGSNSIGTSQGGDPNILRIPAGADPGCPGNHGTLLHQHQVGGNHNDSFGVRGSEYIFASCDCGNTWTLRSRLDPKDFFGGAYINTIPGARTGFDRVDFQYDAQRRILYLSAGAAGPGLENEVLFRSDDTDFT